MPSRWPPITALFALVATLGGCTMPVDNPTDQYKPITFWGYTIGPDRPIAVDCSTTYYPTWDDSVPIGTTYSTDTTLSQAGETAYYFEYTTVLPEECWQDVTSGQNYLVAFVRMRDVITGEEHEHFSVKGYQCLAFEHFSGAGPLSAYETCRSEGGNSFRWLSLQTPDPGS